MPSFAYNQGALALANGSVNFATDVIEIVLVKSSYTPNRDDTNGAPAGNEITGVAGYVGGFGGAGRKVLAGKTLASDTALDRTVYDAADPSNWTLGAGDTIGGYVIQKKGAASDATAVPLWYHDTTDTPTNGSPVGIQFDATGLGYLQQ